MTRCTQAAFDSREKATSAKRTIMRSMHVPSTVSYCEKCDKYHVRSEDERPMSKRFQTILRYMAQGYRDAEIATMMKMSRRTVEWSIFEMTKRFYALSRPNLVAIAIAIGIIDPNEFVPEEAEKKHA